MKRLLRRVNLFFQWLYGQNNRLGRFASRFRVFCIRVKHLGRPQKAALLLLLAVLLGGAVWGLGRSGGMKPEYGDWSVSPVEAREQGTLPERWLPGRESEWSVAVENNSGYQVLVRAAFVETCRRNESIDNPRREEGTLEGDATWLPVPLDPKAYASWRTLKPAELSGAVPDSVVIKQGELLNYTEETREPVWAAYRLLQNAAGTVTGCQKVSIAAEPQENGKLKVRDLRYWYYDKWSDMTRDWAAGSHPDAKNIADEPWNWETKTGPLASDRDLYAAYASLSREVTPGQWWFNPEDGYFYFIGMLSPGETSAPLLEKIGLRQSNRHPDTLLAFRLQTRAEAIYANSIALRTGGWELDEEGELYQNLLGFCR